MKKLFLIFAFLPLLVFGDIFLESQVNNIVQCRIYTFTSSTNTVYTVINDPIYSSLLSSYIPHTFGMIVRDTGAFRFPTTETNANSTVSIRHSIRASINGTSIRYYSPLAFEPLLKLYSFASSFFGSGYRGPGFPYIYNDGRYNYINVSIPNLISDVLSSTNTIYHSLLLSNIHLISSSVGNIDSSTYSLNSNFSNFNEAYTKLNSSQLHPFNNITNLLSLTDGTPLSGLRDFVQDELDPNNFDLSSPEGINEYNKQVQSVNDVLNGLYNEANKGTALKYIDDNSPIFDSYERLGDAFNRSSMQSFSLNSSKIISSLSPTNWVGDVTNLVEYVTNIVEEAEKGRRELESLNNSITQALKDIIANSNAVKVVGEDGGAVEVVGVNGGVVEVGGKDGGAVEVTGLDGKPIIIQGEVTLDDDLQLWVNVNAPIGLDEATLQVLTGSNDLIEQTLIDFKSLFQQWYQDDEDNSWLKFFDMARDWRINEIADNTSNQVDVAWEIHSAVTNILASMTNEFSALLLTDYEQFVSNGVYDSMVSLSRSFQSDCLQYGSASYSDMLDSLGLGSGEGNWWQYITVHLGLLGNLSVTNYYMMSYVFSNLVATVQYANDQLEEYDGFFGIANKVISSIPKEEDVISQIDSITNSINTAASGFDDVYSNLDSTTNKFNQAITTYYIKKDLPDNIELRLLPDIDPFEIPVGEHRELFDLLRMGMAFAISIVNIILLPKFILKLFTLFFGVVDSQIKIASMDQSNI